MSTRESTLRKIAEYRAKSAASSNPRTADTFRALAEMLERNLAILEGNRRTVSKI